MKLTIRFEWFTDIVICQIPQMDSVVCQILSIKIYEVTYTLGSVGFVEFMEIHKWIQLDVNGVNRDLRGHLEP